MLAEPLPHSKSFLCPCSKLFSQEMNLYLVWVPRGPQPGVEWPEARVPQSSNCRCSIYIQTPIPPVLTWRKPRARAEPAQRPKGLKHKGPASRRPRFEMETRPQCSVSLDVRLAKSRFPHSPPHSGLHSPKPEPTHPRAFFPRVLPSYVAISWWGSPLLEGWKTS